MGASMSSWSVLSSSALDLPFDAHGHQSQICETKWERLLIFCQSSWECWLFSSIFPGWKPVKCQNSTPLSFHSTGTTQPHTVIRRKLLFLSVLPFVTWLWKKALSVFQLFTKSSRKQLFCLLIEALFFTRYFGWGKGKQSVLHLSLSCSMCL